MEYKFTIEEAETIAEGLMLKVKCEKMWTEVVETTKHETKMVDVLVPADKLPPPSEWAQSLPDVIKQVLSEKLVRVTGEGVEVTAFAMPESGLQVEVPLKGKELTISETGEIVEK